MDDLIDEIKRVKGCQTRRVLITTLTKRMAESGQLILDLTLIFVCNICILMDTLRRVELLRELRLGWFDVLVSINHLREKLDLPEVSLVAILDADKEALRSATSLIQTIGRAARNVSGQVHVCWCGYWFDEESCDETRRRRQIQIAYNKEHGIDPKPLRKKIADVTDMTARENADTKSLVKRFFEGR